ncbi:SRPBCC domain-containing protein [Helcobacillus massiliensis]|uniref:Uncharacterized protein YndB with AHSA1/START domain n=1 Tax=Helcobacillus massiliensis TaxID=521392 RepID=A0A839QY96_9MICO|nr:SRPBCC domain-containing protein [Helcobacillus massiliensis]MBB3023820.1 uncharacterized protein YndB with AHSA1/START domain [Helcobacillus massiliensis]MDK7741417.1 SRPBCC domain-containing protein [Helcobacillus massiliensis]WOO92737.1 SRPBCC domain-containing protein [Helcobacillus massiliensis]
MDINERIQTLDYAASMDAPRGPEFLTLRYRPSTPTSQDVLWQFITQPERLAQWSPIVPERPLTEVGSYTAHEHEGDAGFTCDVIRVAPAQELVHRWGEDRLTWAVSPEGHTLSCTMELMQPEYASMYAAGWQVCFGVLDALLAGQEQERIVGDDAMKHGWRDLQKKYVGELPGQSSELPFG